ncbi:MAG: hypothetical protein L6425_00695, partial [Candidatus Aminicenantes bacterium]|nr:hypothetical protein [Candidatus Aminicenantes bacterium]
IDPFISINESSCHFVVIYYHESDRVNPVDSAKSPKTAKKSESSLLSPAWRRYGILMKNNL